MADKAKHSLNGCGVSTKRYLILKRLVIEAGYEDDVQWAENVQPVDLPCKFVAEYCFVVLNSGMKAQVASGIWRKVKQAIRDGQPIRSVFKHPGKSAAIERAIKEGVDWFERYQRISTVETKLSYLESLPWIGRITKWHLAKNLGLEAMKPDRHLVRIFGCEEMSRYGCARLAEETGDRIGTVDYVIWRAANLGWI